jgi:hypothetical protein
MDALGDAPIGARRSAPRWPGGRLFFLSTFTSTSAPYRFEMDRAGNAEDDPNYLFSLPEYSKAFGEIVGDALESLTERKSPVLRELVTTVRGDRVRVQRVSAPNGNVIEIPPTQTALPFRFDTGDVTRFDLRSFARACDEAAEVLTDAKLDQLLNTVGQIAEGLGRVGDAGGRQFGWPALLSGLEHVEIDFSSSGDPILPRIVAENDKRGFVEYPPLTEADRPAFDALIVLKRQEAHARRGRR